MNDKDRLIELLCKAPLGFKTFENQYYKSTISKIADYLLANGVIVPPCKVGDKVYAKYSGTNEIEYYVIDKVSHLGSIILSLKHIWKMRTAIQLTS